MYNAEMAGEQMGSVCLAEVVAGGRRRRTVRGGVGLHGRRGRLETRTGPRRPGLRGGRERLPHDRRAGGGRSRRAGGRVPRGAGRRAARRGQGIARAGGGRRRPDGSGLPHRRARGAAAPDARVAPRPSAHGGMRLLLSVSAAGLRLLLFRRQARGRASRDASRLQSVPRPAPPPRGLQPAHTHHVGKIRAQQ